MIKRIDSLVVYVLEEFNRDSQGLSYEDESYENFINPEHADYEDFDILWEECREVNFHGDVVTLKETDLSPEEAIRIIDEEDRSLTAVGTVVDIRFCNGKEFTGLSVDAAKKEIKKEENYYPISIKFPDYDIEFFEDKKKAIEYLVSHYYIESEVVSGEMLASTTISGCSVEDIMEIVEEFKEVVG